MLGLALSIAIWGAAGSAGAEPSAPAPILPHRVLMMLRLPPQHVLPSADYGGAYGDGLQHSALRRVADRLARAHGLKVVDDWPMPLVGVDCFVLEAPPDQSLDEVVASLSREPQVAWSEPVMLFAGSATAPGVGPGRLFQAEPAAREWRLAKLHEVATGQNVRVAVIDSQIDGAHPDLTGQVATSRNFVAEPAKAAEGHGTAVAGVIAARGVGVDGVAPGSRLMGLRACWQQGIDPEAATLCDNLSLARALEFAIEQRAQVINMSLAGPTDPLLGKLLDAAKARRIPVVAAFDRRLPAGGFPASHPGVIAVADEAWGAPPAGVYSAPGRDVPTTTPGGHWALVNGSSFAAAHVSGLVALARQKQPDWLGPLRSGATPDGARIDACATLLGARGCDGGGRAQAAALGPHPAAPR
jgi:subtilisin family serine protease